MEKDLIKIVKIKDDIVSAEFNPKEPRDYDRAGAAILSLMDKDDQFAKQVISVASLFMLRRNDVAVMNETAKHSAQVKLIN